LQQQHLESNNLWAYSFIIQKSTYYIVIIIDLIYFIIYTIIILYLLYT